ncbi:MAG TPA: hypothetical protein VFW07_09980 [Parafilimonas sp.]|nr:hypothetical protein [Parafilimonas sp.]
MTDNKYKLDRHHVTSMSFEEADDHTIYWLGKTEDERLNAACFLINQLYGVTPQTKVGRTIIDSRKFS